MAQSLERAIETVLATADGQKMNETNSRVLLIEPMLDALGWDTRDLGVVTREYAVYDGTFLDYALLDDGRPALFVEAKALGANLDDPKLTAQTVNYANNEGVQWCVLTDGLRWRVYKTNEPVTMDRKLVFEVSLKDAADPDQRAAVLRSLSHLARDAVAGGQLDEVGSRLFDDQVVRAALGALFQEAPDGLLSMVDARLPPDRPAPSKDRLRVSLARITRPLTDGTSAPVNAPEAPTPAAKVKVLQTTGKRAEFSYEHHFSTKPQDVRDLYERLDDAVKSRGEDIQRIHRKNFVGYRTGKQTFFSVVPQRSGLKIFFNLPHRTGTALPTRDVSGVGHWGVGDMEAVLSPADDLDPALQLMDEALARARSH